MRDGSFDIIMRVNESVLGAYICIFFANVDLGNNDGPSMYVFYVFKMYFVKYSGMYFRVNESV